MEKAEISKEQAEAIELMKAKGAPLNEIVERHIHKDHILVNNFGFVQTMSTDTLIRSLYIGYEVEESPADRVKEIFDYFDQGAVAFAGVDVRNKIARILNILCIGISGINQE